MYKYVQVHAGICNKEVTTDELTHCSMYQMHGTLSIEKRGFFPLSFFLRKKNYTIDRQL